MISWNNIDFHNAMRYILYHTLLTLSEKGCNKVEISYNKLWKLMIDHKMNKTQLRKAAGLSSNVVAKLSKNDSVSLDSLLRICKTLNCDIGDIVELKNESDSPLTTNPGFAQNQYIAHAEMNSA